MDEEKAKKDMERYAAALHAVQSGVAMEVDLDHPDWHRELQRAWKHLRVGVDSCKVEQAALVAMLVQRGVLAEGEYLTAMADAMEVEVRRLEGELSNRLRTQVRLA